MKKETILFDNIKQDLLDLVKFNFTVKNDWRILLIIVCSFYSVLLFLLFWAIGEIYLGLIFGLGLFLLPAFHIIKITKSYLYYNSMKNYIQGITEREQISVSVETLSHITNEEIYEPYISFARIRTYKKVCFLHFGSGSWRVPGIISYRWNKELCIGPQTFENTSLKGDEFYYISLQGYPDITYIYPCKFFRLDNSLIKDDN